MYRDWLPRVPGAGLAPTPEARHVNVRAQDALLRDALAREDATYRESSKPSTTHARRHLVRRILRRPLRAGA